MDLVTVFHAEGSSTAEIEALAVKGLLEANGIQAVVVGDSVLPNLPFEVKVADSDAKRARKLIAEVEKKRTAAAESAEKKSNPRSRVALPPRPTRH